MSSFRSKLPRQKGLYFSFSLTNSIKVPAELGESSKEAYLAATNYLKSLTKEQIIDMLYLVDAEVWSECEPRTFGSYISDDSGNKELSQIGVDINNLEAHLDALTLEEFMDFEPLSPLGDGYEPDDAA